MFSTAWQSALKQHDDCWSLASRKESDIPEIDLPPEELDTATAVVVTTDIAAMVVFFVVNRFSVQRQTAKEAIHRIAHTLHSGADTSSDPLYQPDAPREPGDSPPRPMTQDEQNRVQKRPLLVRSIGLVARSSLPLQAKKLLDSAEQRLCSQTPSDQHASRLPVQAALTFNLDGDTPTWGDEITATASKRSLAFHHPVKVSGHPILELYSHSHQKGVVAKMAKDLARLDQATPDVRDELAAYRGYNLHAGRGQPRERLVSWATQHKRWIPTSARGPTLRVRLNVPREGEAAGGVVDEEDKETDDEEEDQAAEKEAKEAKAGRVLTKYFKFSGHVDAGPFAACQDSSHLALWNGEVDRADLTAGSI